MSKLSKLYKKLNEKNNPAIRLDKAIKSVNEFGALQHGFIPAKEKPSYEDLVRQFQTKLDKAEQNERIKNDTRHRS